MATRDELVAMNSKQLEEICGLIQKECPLAGNWKNALRTMLSTKSLDDPLHGTCKHKIKIF